MFFKVTRSRDVQTEMSCLAREIHVLRWVLRQGRENCSRTLFKRPKSDKIWQSGKYRNPRKQREKWCFLPSKYKNVVVFQDIHLKFVAHMTWQCSFTSIPFVYFNSCFKVFRKEYFIDYFPKCPEFSKFRKSEIAVWWALHSQLLLKTNRFYLESCLRDSFPANPYFFY